LQIWMTANTSIEEDGAAAEPQERRARVPAAT